MMKALLAQCVKVTGTYDEKTKRSKVISIEPAADKTEK